MKSVLLFCGSATGNDQQIIEEAKFFGRYLAQNNYRLIYGGGNIGIMGIVATEVMNNGGQVVGIIPQFLMEKEVGKIDTTEIHIVKSMHERKAMMCDLADMVIALPGGFGTFDELFEMLTWLQLGLHNKPIGVLNVNGFFDLLLKQLDHLVEKEFLKLSNRELIIVDNKTKDLIDKLENVVITQNDKWFRDRNLS
ncbi:MAG: TIGR00730 family Rossman fold protein [bacterium]|jgi:uncharacterized protein (TIGR00730 family)